MNVSDASTVGLAIFATFFACDSANAQSPQKIFRIGILSGTDPSRIGAFQQGLREAGYIEGKTSVLERRDTEGTRNNDAPGSNNWLVLMWTLLFPTARKQRGPQRKRRPQFRS